MWWRWTDRSDRGNQGGLEQTFEHTAESEQGRLPLPSIGDPWQAPVVKLVTEIERELEILIPEWLVGRDERQRIKRVWGMPQILQQRPAHFASGGRKALHPTRLPGTARFMRDA